jgi:hypothetical protein
MRPATAPVGSRMTASVSESQALTGRKVGAGGEVALDHLDRRPSQRRDCRDSRDLLGRRVPEHDVSVAIDGDDAVCDVGQDRVAAFPLQRHPLVELGVRQDRRRVAGQSREGFGLLVAPGPRPAVIDREHALQPSLGTDERYAQVGAVARREHRIVGQEPRVGAGVGEGRRRSRLDDVPRQPGRRRSAEADSPVEAFALHGVDDQFVALDHANRSCVGFEQSRRLLDDLVEHRSGIELGGEQRAHARELLGEGPRRALALVELASLERAARGPGEPPCELQIIIDELTRRGEEDDHQAAVLTTRRVDGDREQRAEARRDREASPRLAEAIVVRDVRRSKHAALGSASLEHRRRVGEPVSQKLGQRFRQLHRSGQR